MELATGLPVGCGFVFLIFGTRIKDALVVGMLSRENRPLQGVGIFRVGCVLGVCWVPWGEEVDSVGEDARSRLPRPSCAKLGG